MKTLVVYDSVFGNTEKIARAIGSGLASQANCKILQVNNVKTDDLKGLTLLIVGSPTRGFRPTPATADFLKNLPESSLNGVKVAAFDTRIATHDIDNAVLRFLAGVGGYAAKPIAELLKKKGGDLVAAPEGFFVNDKEGPLKDSELDRAVTWASSLLVQVQPAVAAAV